MAKIEDLCNELYEKLSRELREYKRELREQNADMIIRSSYETTIKEQFPDIFFGKSYYDEYELRALLDLDNSLNGLYNAWMDADSGIHNILEDTVSDFVMDLADEYVKEQETKIKQKENYEFILEVCESLNNLKKYSFGDYIKDKYGIKNFDIDLIDEVLDNKDVINDYDNYIDFDICDYIKNKYEIDELNLISVDKILNDKNSLKDLYNQFVKLENSDYLKYFNQAQVRINKDYQNIEDRIIPELKKIIAKQERNNKNYERDIER